jgi:hypothetical protein
MKYIFVDVDGVLNSDNSLPGSFTVLASPQGYASFKLNLNAVHGKWLLQLAENTDSSLVWGSTWQKYANEWIGSRIGLPEMPHLVIPPFDSPERAKAQAALDYADGAKFVYFDDWKAISNYLDGTRGLHICIDPWQGLQKEHIDRAEQYLKGD